MNYLNFDVDAFNHRAAEGGDQFSVRVASSPVGEQRIAQADRVKLPLSVRQRMAALRQRKLSLAELIRLGEDLGQALFPPSVRSFLGASLSRLRSDDEGLRIRLKLDTYGLAELPWEYVYLPLPDMPGERRGPEGFLALNRRVSLVRYESQASPLAPLEAGSSPLRLVALLASPRDPDYAPLDVAKEQQSIAAAVAEVPALRLDFYPDATVDTLLEALVKPAQIFHFSGHGEFKGDMGDRYGSAEGAGAVILVDETGRAKPFPAQKLALNLNARGVRLAVLTACEVGQRDAESSWAGVVTALTHAGIPAVVGMQFRIRDRNAIAFSRAFYRALAAGQAIDAAVTDGRFAIFNQGDADERDWGVPVLYLRAEDGVLFPQEPDSSGGSLEALRKFVPQMVVKGLESLSASAGEEEAVPEIRRRAFRSEGLGKGGSSRPVTKGGAPVDKRALRDAMMKVFSTDEIEILCSDVQEALADAGIELQVNLDVVGGNSKGVQVLNLITYLERRGYLGYLEQAVREARPGSV
ncbi:MAG: CHAT domain-containing protein [Anaerolineae bacterium]|jgi:hypothetical protein|nr:CHAT domain-containing protein [Anaerolineae bacterium]